MRSIPALFAALFFFSADTYSQSPWTLQQCIDYALQHNLSVKQSEMDVELNGIEVTRSHMDFLPSLNGSASQNYYYGRSIDPDNNQFTRSKVSSNSFSLNSSLSLFEGFRLWNTLKQSRLNYLSAKFDLMKVKNDMALNVATAYLDVIYNKELLAVTTSLRDASKIQRDRVRRMEELGAVSRGNLLDMESQLASDEVSFIGAQAQYDQAILILKQLLELDTVRNFEIAQPVNDAPSLNATYSDVNSIYAAALSNQPDMKSFEYKLKSAEKGLSIARGSRYPRLSLSGSISTTYSTSSQRVNDYVLGSPVLIGYDSDTLPVYSAPSLIPIFEETPFRNQIDNNLGKSLGFSLGIPLFNSWNTHLAIKRAKISLRQTQLGFDMARKNLFKSIQLAVADASSSYQRFQAGEKNVAAQEQSMNFNQKKYDEGLINSYDFLLAKNNFAKAKSDLLKAKYDYILRLKILDFYMGKPLSF